MGKITYLKARWSKILRIAESAADYVQVGVKASLHKINGEKVNGETVCFLRTGCVQGLLQSPAKFSASVSRVSSLPIKSLCLYTHPNSILSRCPLLHLLLRSSPDITKWCSPSSSPSFPLSSSPPLALLRAFPTRNASLVVYHLIHPQGAWRLSLVSIYFPSSRSASDQNCPNRGEEGPAFGN